MSGPSSIDRETLDKRVKRRQFWSEAFAWLVGGGLLIEYGQEIFDCFVNWYAPSLPLIGGVLVTLGVFGEVWFSRLALNASDELQKRADSDVAQANERAAHALERATSAELATADATLARIKLEHASRARTISETAMKAMSSHLKEYAGTKVVIETFPDNEPRHIGLLILVMLSMAEWDVPSGLVIKHNDLRPDRVIPLYFLDMEAPGIWMDLALPQIPFCINERLRVAADALAKELNDNGIVARPRLNSVHGPDTICIAVNLKPAQGEAGAEYGAVTKLS
ncbi:MAG: hypothetical protein M3Y27_09170 [Acidobacteriota bacterium]|nr:hypothetical protein [Acidobacteriota bacterium]